MALNFWVLWFDIPDVRILPSYSTYDTLYQVPLCWFRSGTYEFTRYDIKFAFEVYEYQDTDHRCTRVMCTTRMCRYVRTICTIDVLVHEPKTAGAFTTYTGWYNTASVYSYMRKQQKSSPIYSSNNYPRTSNKQHHHQLSFVRYLVPGSLVRTR